MRLQINPTHFAYLRTHTHAHMRHQGGDEDTFKAITKAYEILGDEEKRKLYDQYGEKGVKPGGGGGGGAGDIFTQMFGGGRGGGGRGGPRKGGDVLFRLEVGLDDLYNGATKKLRLTRQVICKSCGGTGGEDVRTCTTCKGHGVRLIIRRLGPGMIQQMQAQCDECDGEGQVGSEGRPSTHPLPNPSLMCHPCIPTNHPTH